MAEPYYFYLPRMCNHCTDAACLEACPTMPCTRTRTFGLVLRNEDLCQGAHECAAACPYKKIYFNEPRGVSQQCIGCFPGSRRAWRPPASASAPRRSPRGSASSMTHGSGRSGSSSTSGRAWRCPRVRDNVFSCPAEPVPLNPTAALTGGDPSRAEFVRPPSARSTRSRPGPRGRRR